MTHELLREALLDNLRHNILDYWLREMVDPKGGLYGQRDGHNRLHPDAPKGAILHGRALWTFSAAYRTTRRPEYLAEAQRLKQYLTDRFIDPDFGGVYWSLTPDGEPLDTKKQFYAIGFCIYGFSEYARATGEKEALQTAIDLFHTIEAHSRDRRLGGYLEAQTRNWQPIADMRLSDKDANEAKTMNTHLHIIEPYVNLYRVWPDPALREAIESLLHLFFDTIEDKENHHLGLFFDEEWNRHDHIYSYGHDIEASWLLLEAARVLGDDVLLEKALKHTAHIAHAALDGIRPDGSMVYERHADGQIDEERHWWVQAEAMIGQIYLYKFHGETAAYEGALRTWQYINEHIVDHQTGEWYWSRMPDGTVNRRDDHAGFWKCPYHNGRMCMEIIDCLTD